MGLQDIDIKLEYRTKLSNVAKEFLVPALSEAISYKRAVGFFSSSVLLEIATGIGRIAQNDGRIKLVASPNLSPEDVNAISKGYELREKALKEKLLSELPSPESLSEFDKNRFNLLANLIAQNILDIRIAFAESSNGMGIFHDKVAIIEDSDGNKIAFSGGMNESRNAMVENYDTIRVFKSWQDPEDRVRLEEAAFDSIWDGNEPGLHTFVFREVKDEIVCRYLVKETDFSDDLIPQPSEQNENASVELPGKYPCIPNEYTLRNYQLEAIEKWKQASYRGIYDMATGAGKTVTALASVVSLSESLSNHLAVVIVCPYQHLVDQWVEDLVLFNINPIIGYSSSPQRDWLKRLDGAIRDQRFGVSGSEFFCFICTNGTYATEKVQKRISKIKSEKLLVVDEAHNFGADYISSLLRPDFDYRLALSATIERYGDPEGTEALFSYFGSRCIEYTLEEAIYGRGIKGEKDCVEPCLTPYRYYPIVVYLEDQELSEYAKLSRQISKSVRVSKTGEKKLTEQGKKLALKRARLVAAAHQKLSKLKETIVPYSADSFTLVYCGATRVEIDSDEIENVDEFELRQIDAVTHILGDEMNMKVRQFTSRESSSDRELIKKAFSKGELQALIAIKCLDEGVNIPLIKTAFILASTTNPREYVQRRGRLLRKDKDGLKKRAEIYDFVTLPRTPEDASVLPDDAIRGEERLVYNELVRAREFAELAENRAQATQILDEIEEAYFGVNGIEGFSETEVE